MKRLLLLAAVALLVVIPSVVYAGHLGVSTGKAKLHPANQSGVTGEINFVDNGVTLTVTGTAAGLSGGEFSLLYDNGSVPGGPASPPTAQDPSPNGICEPAFGGLGFAKMFIGGWSAPVGGVSTLGPIVKAGPSYVPLADFRSVSIRTAPGAENVVACGQVADHP